MTIELAIIFILVVSLLVLGINLNTKINRLKRLLKGRDAEITRLVKADDRSWKSYLEEVKETTKLRNIIKELGYEVKPTPEYTLEKIKKEK